MTPPIQRVVLTFCGGSYQFAWCDQQGRCWNHGRQVEVEGWLDPETGERHEVGELFPCAEKIEA